MKRLDEKTAARTAALKLMIIRCLRQEKRNIPRLVESKSLISDSLFSDIMECWFVLGCQRYGKNNQLYPINMV
jgi:hypothetical protein